MKFLKRAERNFAALLMTPLVEFESRERERRLRERSQRTAKRYPNN
jgi:hypothetical protein